MIDKFLKSNWGFYSIIGALVVTSLSLMPEQALAQSGVEIFRDTVCNVIVTLQGDVVRAVAAFGIIFLGFSLFLGKITWGVGLAIGIGLGAVLGAEQIVNVMSPGESQALSCTLTA